MNDLFKYPKTAVLPWSGEGRDDKRLANLSAFVGRDVVVTVKLDGENTTMYQNFLHSRSLTFRTHPSRTWVQNLHSQIKYNIPTGYRICGENVFAKHTIHYHNLTSYFYCFAIWKSLICLDWQETTEIAKMVGIEMIPVLYTGPFEEIDFEALNRYFITGYNGDDFEGYVLRTKAEFTLSEFSTHVAKCVRRNHVQTDQHWFHQKVTRNELRKK